MSNFNYKKIFLLLFALGIAYFVSSFSIKNVFLANSPKIRPNLGGYFLAKINNTKEKILAKLNFNFNLFPSFNIPGSDRIATNQQNRQEIANALKSSLKPITKGVSAASKDGYHYFEFTLNEIEWVEITYTLKNGEIVKIRYPKGTNPPPKEIYE